MNRLYLLAYFLLIAVIPSFAQLSVGVKSSIPFFNASRLTGDYGLDRSQTSYQGYFGIMNAGLFGKYSFQKNWGVSVEVLYKNQGFKYQNNEGLDGADWDGTFNLDYIETPLLLQYEGENELRWYVQAGPSVKFLTKATHSFHHWGSQDGGVTFDDSENVKGIFNKTVLTANVGGGISYDLSKEIFLTGDLRFSYDITAAAQDKRAVLPKSGDAWSFKNPRMLSMSLSVGIGYKFK